MKATALFVLAGAMMIVGTTLVLVAVVGELPYWVRPGGVLGGLMLSVGSGVVVQKAMGA